MRFYHDTQNSVQFKPYKVFISEIFHLTFLDLSLLQVTEMVESETADNYCIWACCLFTNRTMVK